MSKWFCDYRQKWIKDHIDTLGFINRGVIMDKFDIAAATATRDISAFRDENPSYLEYDVESKIYRRRKDNAK